MCVLSILKFACAFEQANQSLLFTSAVASYNLDIVGQGPTALAVGAGGGCLNIFTLIFPFSSLSPSLWETVRYRLKGPLNPKQPTNQPSPFHLLVSSKK